MNLFKRSVCLWLCVIFSFQTLSHAIEQKEWTFLVFLNGHNNLDSFGKMNMKQMETVGSSDKVNVVVQWASSSSSTTKRILVKKSNNSNEVTSPVVEDLPRVDMGNWKSLVEFVEWGVKNYPAKHYFINVWNHGGGWHRRTKNPLRDISNDDFSGNSISTIELGQAMEESAKIIGHKVDIYGSDACLMGMIEVGYEMKDSVELFLGSQEVEPGAGWPYDKLLSKWIAKPTMSSVEVAKTLDHEYVAAGGYNRLTLSTTDLRKVDSVVEQMGKMSQELEKLSFTEKRHLNDAWENAERFYHNDYADFMDAVNIAKGLSFQALTPEVFTSVSSALTGFIVDNQTSSALTHATGASLWIPSTTYTYDTYAERYKNLKFDKATNWSKTLAWLLKN